MGHDDQGLALFIEIVKELQDLGAGGGIQIPGRLVRQEDQRVIHQSAGDGHALLLAAGELGGLVIAAESPSPTRSAISRAKA